MSIGFEKLKNLTEEKIGEGKSSYMFGKYWEKLYCMISEEEDNLTEEMFREALRRCRFKDPEKVGLFALVCPPLCTYITDRILGNWWKDAYRFVVYIWYFSLIVTAIHSLIMWEMDKELHFMVLCMIVTSWSFRNLSRDYNKFELLFHTLDVDGKIDRVLRRERRE